MKTFCLTTAFAVLLLISLNGVQAQTVTTNLDQLKLMQQFRGTWQRNIGKDTVVVLEYQLYGNAYAATVNLLINGKKSFYYSVNSGFSLKEGKFRTFILYSNGNYMTYLGSYITEKKFSYDIVQNFDPAKVLGKIEITFDTPTNMTQTFFNSDGVKTREVKFSKVK